MMTFDDVAYAMNDVKTVAQCERLAARIKREVKNLDDRAAMLEMVEMLRFNLSGEG